MARRTRGRVVAGILSMLVPGAGQFYAGARRRGLLLLGVSAVLALEVVAIAATRPSEAAAWLVDRRAVAGFVLVNLALLAVRMFAVVDAWRRASGPATRLSAAALAVLAGVTAAPHVAAAYAAVATHDVLDSVFAEEEPRDVLASRLLLAPAPVSPAGRPRGPIGMDVGESLPEPVRVADLRLRPLASSHGVLASSTVQRPWVTILLLGSDNGPGQAGDRTDTIILVALERGTGRAAAFGVPRNLVDVPLGGAARRALPRFRRPLNALYSFARTRPDLFPGGRDQGATALKQTVSRLLGIRVDYYALVTLLGFADMVDALGGVEIQVKERLVDEVTRPAWGEPKPTIDVLPGRTYHFFGREALAYVRSRKASNDYTRMARQRCFLSAMTQQLDVVAVLRHFGRLAAVAKQSVRTDIPLGRVPDLVRLVGAVDARRTLTETFGREYIARRRPVDRFPVPKIGKIRTTVRRVILASQGASPAVPSAARAC
jgi:LCP family protein required for cell wall assembly